MIYLIDDKKDRQQLDYNWNPDRLAKYSDYLKVIYSYEEIKSSHLREEIFQNGNIILFHESFFDNSSNYHQEESLNIRNKLKELAEDGKIWLVLFSGSKNSRNLVGQIAHLSVSICDSEEDNVSGKFTILSI